MDLITVDLITIGLITIGLITMDLMTMDLITMDLQIKRPDKKVYLNIISLMSQPKHMFKPMDKAMIAVLRL